MEKKAPRSDARGFWLWRVPGVLARQATANDAFEHAIRVRRLLRVHGVRGVQRLLSGDHDFRAGVEQ